MPFPFQLKPPVYARILEQVQAAAYETVAPLTCRAWVSEEPLPFAERETGQPTTLELGTPWGRSLFDCAWMHFTGTVPPEAAGKPVVAVVDFSGEGLVVDAAGEPVQGLTTVSSEFDRRYGIPVKRILPLMEKAAGGEPVEFWVDAANNDLFGDLPESGRLQQMRLAVLHPAVLALGYDLEVLIDLLGALDPKSARAQRLQAKLYEATRLLRDPADIDAEAQAARAVLAPELAKRGGDPSLTLSAVGHAHMDLAWLWPIRETKRKCARTFSTVLTLMERYPEFLFGASQPQQYQWVKEGYPGLYARIKEQIAAGRWEAQGAMWVEPDTNITGGESLIRQIVYGRQFFRDEFGAEPDHLWEPDVFGYTGALPQILAKSGIKHFMTQKLSWNEINKFPHQTFWWEGIDGSRVLTHMLPEESYLSPALPHSVRYAERNYFDSPVAEEALLLFGIGDGGGGPGEEHLERLARVENLEGVCPVRQEFAGAFFKRLEKNADKYVTWRGELYLEKHQGTLTSQARTKRYNRKIEYLLREVELSAVWAVQANHGYQYPSDALDRIWKEVLLYQFHDILPGSSITRVYTESLARYAVLQEELEALLRDADAAWQSASHGGTVVNSLSWPRTEWLQAGGTWRHVSVLGLSRAALPAPETADLSEVRASDTALENDLLEVTFAADGTVASVYDKEHGREALEAGGAGNLLALYDDTEDADAWDFRIDYAQRPPSRAALLSAEVFTDGPRAVRRSVYRVGKTSTLFQDVIVTLGSRRIDFVTRTEWSERGKMLRASFPVAVQSPFVTCDIQFGTITRPTTSNTTWDAAVQEIAAHKWVDLSEPGYGVALLNDCKYGHKVKGSVLDLNLLRGTVGPDPVADIATHEFIYSLLPHAGSPAEAGVMREGYALNIPLRPLAAAEAAPAETPSSSAPWLNISAPSVIAETIKRSEDKRAVVVRLYESAGARTSAQITLSFGAASVELTDLDERHPRPLAAENNAVTLDFGPFEIHTLKITLA